MTYCVLVAISLGRKTPQAALDMGIKFPCAHCGQRLNIKSDLAGKRGICPHCHAKIDIPTESVPRVKSPTSWAKEPTTTSLGAGEKSASIDDSDATTFDPAVPRTIPSVAPVTTQTAAGSTVASAAQSTAAKLPDPIDEAPELRWYVMPEGATDKYGPAPGDVMRGWVADGRVGVDSLVWREDWPDWLEAAKVFPQLSKKSAPQATAPVSQGPAAQKPAPAANPAAFANPVQPMSAPAAAPTNPVRPVVAAGPGTPAATAANPLAGIARPGAPLFKVDEPVRHLGAAQEYVPANKRSKTGSLIAIIVLALAMLVLVPVVIWVLTRQ